MTLAPALSAITWLHEVKANGHVTDHYDGTIDGLDMVGCLAIAVAAVFVACWTGEFIWHGVRSLAARWRERSK